MLKKSSSRSTLADIADKLGLSAMTVSRALNGKPEVSEETRERVKSCALDLSYRPNRWARSLVTRRSSIVGVVIPDIAHSFFAEITCGIEEIMDGAGYDILLCHSRGDMEKEKAEINMLVGSRVDGLIVASVQPENAPGLFVMLRKMRLPFVLIDRFFPGVDFPYVRVNDRAVGRMATECLIRLKHRRIAHIRGPALSPATLRYHGYLDALKTAGIGADKGLVVDGNMDIDSGRGAMNRLLKLKPRPTSVFAANDPMAIGAVYACREAGLRVPADLSIIGAGNIEGPYHPDPFITTLDWAREELGRTAAALLLECIRDPDRPPVIKKVFQPRLLIRQSIGKPAS